MTFQERPLTLEDDEVDVAGLDASMASATLLSRVGIERPTWSFTPRGVLSLDLDVDHPEWIPVEVEVEVARSWGG